MRGIESLRERLFSKSSIGADGLLESSARIWPPRHPFEYPSPSKERRASLARQSALKKEAPKTPLTWTLRSTPAAAADAATAAAAVTSLLLPPPLFCTKRPLLALLFLARCCCCGES